MTEFTQGDRKTLKFKLKGLDLTGYTITVNFPAATPGGACQIVAADCTPDPDQEANQGVFTALLRETVSVLARVGRGQDITVAAVPSGQTAPQTYRGHKALSVWPVDPGVQV